MAGAVAGAVAFKYRAFLSYAHADKRWAQWLHRRLEGFALGADLAAKATLPGPVDKAGRANLAPIFLDRGNFTGGSSLTDATLAALEASAALIVLCSPTSAGRPAVQEEVRLFRARHPERPVIPVLIAGTAATSFPPALRFALNADGTVSDQPVTLLGVDLREAADGRSLGLAKVVAGLLGLADANDVYRRELRRARRAALQQGVAAAVLLAALGGAGWFYWLNVRSQQTLTEVAAIAAQYAPLTGGQGGAPGSAEAFKATITNLVNGDDPRQAQALALIKAGKPKEAEPLLAAVAEDKKKRAQKDAKDSGKYALDIG